MALRWARANSVPVVCLDLPVTTPEPEEAVEESPGDSRGRDPLTFGWLDTGEVVAWLKANKPDRLHLVLTGRNAPDELVEYADMVTEMREVRHPFRFQQIPAQKGIDF